MRISVVIPTKNRVNCLSRLLRLILEQTVLPSEVIVVDDSDNLTTKRLVGELSGCFWKREIRLKYIYLDGKNESISKKRNLGARESNCEIVVFLDDDIVINKNYLKEILHLFRNNQNALGVQGLIVNTSYSHFWNCVKKVFYNWYYEADKCKMLPSGKTILAYSPTSAITCEWLSGSNMAYKKAVFKEFNFNEKLLGYSLGEDKELSYKIHKKYPGRLFLTPKAKVCHLPPKNNISKRKMYITIIYPVGFFLNNIEQTIKNKVIFIWSEIGRFVLNIIWSLPNMKTIKHIIGAYVCLIKHFNDVKEQNYRFIFTNDDL